MTRGRLCSGLAPAKLGAATGFIDKSGDFAFYLPFDYAPGFPAGSSEADVSRFWTEDQKFGYVTMGRVIWGPTAESPDCPPLFGTDEDKAASCEGIPDAIRTKIAGFPR